MRFRTVALASLTGYLAGWPFVQAAYNRLLAAWRRRELANPSSATHEYYRQQAAAIVDVMEARGHLVRPVRRGRADG